MSDNTEALVREAIRMRDALDAIYRHNEAARAAVVQHYGTLHHPLIAALAQQATTPTLASPGLPDIDMPVAEAITYWRTAARQNWEASNKLLAQLDEARQAATPAPAEPTEEVVQRLMVLADTYGAHYAPTGNEERTQASRAALKAALRTALAAPPATPAAQAEPGCISQRHGPKACAVIYCHSNNVCARAAAQAGDALPPPADVSLGQIAYKGFDAYWHEGSEGIEADAWEAAAQAVVAALAARGQAGEREAWIPVSERLPQDGQDVLLVMDGYRYAGIYRPSPLKDGLDWIADGSLAHADRVTHWLPLPAAPRGAA